MARTISSSINGPFVLSLSDPLATDYSDDPLTITGTGTITSTGDGIDGDASAPWTITNQGQVLAQGNGIALAGAGFLTNSGTIESTTFGGYGVEIGGFGSVTNNGVISGTTGLVIGGTGIVNNNGAIAFGVQIDDFGQVTNHGSISGGITIDGGGVVANSGQISFWPFADGIDISGGAGKVTNSGSIQASETGVRLDGGGELINGKTGIIQSSRTGVEINGTANVINNGSIIGGEFFGLSMSSGTVTNGGLISGAAGLWIGGSAWVTNTGTIYGSDATAVSLETGRLVNHGLISYETYQELGVDIANGGTVINTGTINGGIEIAAGSGTVANKGIISGASFSVSFDPSTSNNLLMIGPNAVFNGVAQATSGTNSTIELTAGTSAISGIGTGQFDGFDNLTVDPNANWTMNGTNTIGTVLNHGSLAISGSLDVSTAVNPASNGLFELLGGSTLDVAAALGSSEKMSFATGSDLTVDNFAMFGTNVGASDYTGPLLENFGGSTIDLKDFSSAGLSQNYSSTSGLLQLANGSSQLATLHFQDSSLGSGTFHFNDDGASGILITHS
jgi:hypothetical protein